RRPGLVSPGPQKGTRRPKPGTFRKKTSPLPGSPPIHCAMNTTTPSATAKSGRNHLVLVIRIEHLLDGRREEAGERERERQRGRIGLLLDRIDRVPRDRGGGRGLALRETAV